jgi:predicted NBD/HSP70 family sugar kinase
MKEETRALFVGIDWGEETCQVCVTDREGKVLKEWATEHSGDGFEKLFERLLEIASAPAEAVAVAIEMPRGALVEGLLERGFTVYSINPKQLDRFRDRYSPAGAKDDRRDAFVLAETLRTDGPLYRKLHQDDPTTIELR